MISTLIGRLRNIAVAMLSGPIGAPPPPDPVRTSLDFYAVRARVAEMNCGLYRSDPADGPRRYFIAHRRRTLKFRDLTRADSIASGMRSSSGDGLLNERRGRMR